MKTLFEKMRANRAKAQAVQTRRREQHYGGRAAQWGADRQRQFIAAQTRSRALQQEGFERGLASPPWGAWN